MTHRADLFVWLVLPYVSLTVFAVGHWWRYRRDQFGWTSRSTQLLESRLLAWTSDVIVFVLLGALILLGDGITFGYNVFGSGYDYYLGRAYILYRRRAAPARS